MKKPILYGLITILFLATFATAQFPKIKIPKLPKVDKEKIKTSEVPGVSNSLGSTKGKNRQNVMDDGYTLFDATPVKEYSDKLRGEISKGWSLYPYLRAFGTFPNNSGFNVIVSKNGKALGKFVCSGKTYRKSEDQDPRKKNLPDDDYMMSDDCSNTGKFIAESGMFDVQVFTVNGDTDAETAVRTYKIEVKEAKKIRPGNVPGITDYFIQRHAEAPASILYLRPNTNNIPKHNYHNIVGGTTLKGNVDIIFNVTLTQSQIEFSGVPYVRCSVNGERVNFQANGEVKEASVRGDKVNWERDGKAPQFIGFYQYWLNLPIQWQADGPSSSNPDMKQKTGNWECELRNRNETIRKFKWTVGSDGYPVEHAEQKSGNINLPWGAYLIETEFPSTENSINERLMPMPNAGLFYGIPWKTEEGKKMAASVPKVGEPYFIP